MSAMHVNVHVAEHAPARAHREVRQQAVVRDHRAAERRIELERREFHDRRRPVFITPRPVIVTSPVYGAAWTPAPAYTYQPQPITLMGASSLASAPLSIATANELGGATRLEVESAGTGCTYVTRLVAYDAAGGYQLLDVNATLSPTNPSVVVPIANAANIVRVTIEGHSDWGGAIALQAL